MAHRLRARDWLRGARLAAHLLLQPRDIVPYARFGVFTSKTPLELGIPWWSFGAVRAVECKLKPEMTGFQFGSGGSSLFLVSRLRSLTCIDDEKAWVEKVREAAKERKLSNLRVLHKPYEFWDASGFESSAYLKALSEGSYDVIVIDGKEWSDPVRDVCFWRAEDYIKPGGLIVLDDSARYPQVKAKNRAKRWREYEGCGYCRMGETTTAVFEY